ncbi:unnamed protein product, partial [Chrysoparadoxa australica]
MDSFNKTVQMAPAVGFGTAMRPGLMEGDRDCPGPGAYNIKSTMMKNPNSTFKSPPSFSMRGREKFGSPDLKAVDRTTQLEPGPGHYHLKKYMGGEKQPPQYTFPKDKGQIVRRGAGAAPGPGHYEAPPAVGKQVLSTKRSYSGVGFGTGNRPPLIMVSTADVGPGDYEVPGDCGTKQV